jgi:3-hydroxybutyryl-CoA dehydrogenase
MRIVVLANEIQRKEFQTDPSLPIEWMDHFEAFEDIKGADACIDLLFENHPDRIRTLAHLLPSCVIINSVEDTLQETHPSFVRINGWNSFLSSTLVEASAHESFIVQAEKVFAALGRTVEWVPDVAGFISPRVICSIINEAYLALAEGVSTREDIDTAMKLGTNYPYGPFEWAEKIGKEKVHSLLKKLSGEEKRYAPAEGMRE